MTAKKFLTRQELYDLAWTAPMRKIASTLGISDVALAKHFRKAGIPLPGRGYWAKLEAGKASPRILLPPRALGQYLGIDFGGDRESTWPEPPPEEVVARVIPPLPEFEGDLDAVRMRASELVGTVLFSSLATLHPVVAKLLQADEERRAKQAASKWPSSWDAPIFDAKPERRRLRIVNALFLALSRYGCDVWADRWAAYGLHATVGDVGVRFNLAPSGFKRDDYDRYHAVFPNKGKLKLELTWYQPPPEISVSWEDSDAVPLERQLTDIVVGILVAGEWSLRRGLIRRHAYLVESKAKAVAELHRRAEAAMRMERERREKVERERRETLIAEAESWRRAVDLRAYVEARLNAVAGAATEEGTKAWAQWALAEADRMDPLRCAPGRAAEPNPSGEGAK